MNIENEISFELLRNDGTKPTMKKLIDLKNIFSRQLPKMPKEYIVRLVFDKKHECIVIKNTENKIFGGICYCIFDVSKMAEIVFLAISSDRQVKGYGTKLMNYLKMELQQKGIHFLMTCADNLATGYFKKQGFHKEILMNPCLWKGYLKDYEGSTLMECLLEDGIDYLTINNKVKAQRRLLLEYLKGKISNRIRYEGIPEEIWKKGMEDDNGHMLGIKDVPGLMEINYNEEQLNEVIKIPQGTGFQNSCLKTLNQLTNHRCSWPFLNPVDKEEVPDYYDVIKNPIDFKTIKEKITNDEYRTKIAFVSDVQQVFINAKSYNLKNTIYHKCANELEKFSKELFVNLKERETNEKNDNKMELEQNFTDAPQERKKRVGMTKRRKVK